MTVADGFVMAEAAARSSTLLPVSPALGLVMAVLAVAATGIAVAGRLGHGMAVVRAALRAAAQLAVVSLVIASITRSIPLTVCLRPPR